MKYLPTTKIPREGDIRVWMTKSHRILAMAIFYEITNQDVIINENHDLFSLHIRVFR